MNPSRQRSRPSRRPSENVSYQRLEERQLLATLNVTTTLDVIDATDGVTSLREAVIESNSNDQNDVIVLTAGTYQLSIAGINESDSQTGDLDFAADAFHQVIIRGAGMGQTVIDGNGIDRVFELLEDAHVTIEDLEVTGGSQWQQSVESGRRGAGIFSGDANMALNRVRVTGNVTGGFGVGGGIYVANGVFEINESQIVDNESGTMGSAIFARDTRGTITRSDISRNGVINSGNRFSFSTIESRDTRLTVFSTKLDANFRGINSTNGTLNIQSSRFMAHGNSAADSHFFFKRAYGVKADSTAVEIDDSRFISNEIGVEFVGITEDLVISNSLFHNNFRSVNFGGLALNISGTTIQRQTGGRGGIEILAESGTADPSEQQLNVSDSRFRFNQVSGIRGAVTTTNIVDSVFHANRGLGGVSVLGDLFVRGSSFTGQVDAPGIHHQGENLEIVDTLIQGNKDAGIQSPQAGRMFISNSRIVGNTTLNADGGGIQVTPGFVGSEILISNSLIARNRAIGGASAGGAISIERPIVQPVVIVASSTIVQNRASLQAGVITITADSGFLVDLEFRNSIVFGNLAPFVPILRPTLFNVVGFNSIFDDGVPGDGDIQFGGTGNNNSDRFPAFVDWAGGDFRLTASSLAVDAGDNALVERDDRDVDSDLNFSEFAHDLDFRGRAFGGITDIGAFEFRG